MLLVQQVTKHEILLVIYFIVVVIVLVILFIVFFFTFQKRKNKLLIQQAVDKQRFQQVLIESQNEIQEETLKNVGMELHDNVGQLLSVAKMQLNMGVNTLEKEKRSVFKEALETVKQSLTEVRGLSKAVNGEVLATWTLPEVIQLEIDRINRFSQTKSQLFVSGNPFFVGKKEKIIIFRIVQESCSNVIKHAQANHLTINVSYQKETLTIIIEDDGIGFEETVKGGSGLINMKTRATLIDAQFAMKSIPQKGTQITVTYTIPNESTKSSHS